MSNKIYTREWLNKNEGRAYIIIDGYESDPEEKYYYNDMNVELADCSRSITLDFGFDTEEGKQDRLQKIRSIITHFKNVEEWIHNISVPEKTEKK